ncbi:MAG: helix-turn-helix domain-containing protein [Actinophytocola sp.]|uniref:helix-turn-helix domain-containing protein n=1 Tax=Actinophytocola sp. TaxID=1872138 RepID=UPI003D6AE8C2
MTAVMDERAAAISPPVARRRVARQVRAMREQARLTLDDAAPRLDLTRSSLHRVEVGQTQISVHLARSMMDVYDQHMPDLLDTIRASRTRGWWHDYHAEDLEFVAWEAGASHVREWAVTRVPELLQTEDYARTLLPDTDHLADEMAVRRMRQRRLVDEHNSLALTAVVHESALRNQVGGYEVMRAQLHNLAGRTAWPTVTIRVVPAMAGAHINSSGFQILDFDHPDDLPVMYAEFPGGALREEGAQSVATTRQIFDNACAVALSREDSRTFITQLTR